MEVKNQVAEQDNHTNIGLKPEERSGVVEMLNQLLADEHVLYMKLRNYHWNVRGMHFASLHEFFEDQYDKLEERIDEIAERIQMLGHFAPGSMQELLKMARLEETGHLNGNDRKMLENILLDHEMIIKVLRIDLSDALDKYNDAGTSDFLTALMEDHEKMAWMVRAHLM